MSDSSKAVFLSYASQDAEAARRICEALRTAGVEVWFDQSELRGGDAWDQKIRKQIKKCALFIPVISANTEARREGYFRREWKQAAARSYDIADGTPFLVPVVIDATHDAEALVPQEFLAVQWTRLRGGAADGRFCERVSRLLSGEAPRGPRTEDPGPRTSKSEGGDSRASKGRWLIPAMIAAVVGVGWPVWKMINRPERPAVQAAASMSEARQLVARVYATKPDSAQMTRARFDAAEQLCERAAELDPADAEVWAAWAYLDSWRIQQYERRPGERYESARTKAARAMTYAPESFHARLAQVAYFVLVVPLGNLPRAETLLRQLLEEQPAHPGALRLMVHTVRWLNRRTEEGPFLDRLEQVPGYAATAHSMRGWSLRGRGELAAAQQQAEKSVALGGGSPAINLQMLLCLEWDGDLARAQQLAEQMPAELLLEDDGAVVAVRVFEWRREPEKVLQILRTLNRDWLLANSYTGPKSLLTGRAYLASNRPEAARTEFQFGLRLVNQRLAEAPADPVLLELKVELLEALQDETTASETRQLLAQVTGISPLARRRSTADEIADLHALLSTSPTPAPELRYRSNRPGVTAASLRLSPEFDGLRADPGFAELLRRAEADPRFSPQARVAPAASTAADAKSVALLAFRQLSADPENEFLSDAISDELRSVLGRVPGLKVAATASSFSFKGKRVPPAEIGAQLGVVAGGEPPRQRGSETGVEIRREGWPMSSESKAVFLSYASPGNDAAGRPQRFEAAAWMLDLGLRTPTPPPGTENQEL